MKTNWSLWKIILLGFLLVGQLSGCQKQQHEGIEDIENPGTIGLEKIIWSPVDSNEFLLTASASDFLGESEVYLFNLSDYSKQVITNTSKGDIFGESWSPNGDKILLAANIDTKGYGDGGLWLWDKSAGNLENVLCCNGIDAATFINQNQIIFSPVIGVNKGFADLILFDIGTQDETKFLLDIGMGHVYNLSFSPIRNEMIFALWNDGSSTINILELENSTLTKILVGRTKINHPTWSPNGKMIAFTEPTLDGLSLRIMNIDNGCERMLPRQFSAIFGITWSPNNQKIALIDENDKIIIIDLKEIFKTEKFNSSFLCE